MASDKPKKEIRTMKKTNGKKKVDIEPIEYSTEAQPRETTQDGVPVFCAFDKIAPLTELNPNPGNPNTHDDRQVALLAEIIKATGWRAPITVSKRSGLITKGHGRRLAAIHAGLQFAPVEFQDYASEEEEHADLVADNRIAELSIIDTGKLVDMLQEMDTGAVPLELTGYGAEDLENLLAALEGANDTEDDGADAGTETPAVPIAKLGDVWSLGRHRLICGSSTDRATLERLMDGAKAQMVHTDPPYGVSFIGSGRGTNKFGMIQNDDLRSDELVKDLLAPAFKNIFDFTEDDAGIYIWYATASVREFLEAMTIAGIVNKQQIIWVKNDFVIGHNDYQWAHEPCFYCEKAGQHAAFFGDRGQWTTWKVSLRAAEGLSTTLTGGGDIDRRKRASALHDGQAAERKKDPIHKGAAGQARGDKRRRTTGHHLGGGLGTWSRPPEPEAAGTSIPSHCKQQPAGGHCARYILRFRFNLDSSRAAWAHLLRGRA